MGSNPWPSGLQDSQQPLALQNRPVEPARASTEGIKCAQNTCILLGRHSQTELTLNRQPHTNTTWINLNILIHRPSALLLCVFICICNRLCVTNPLHQIKACYINMNWQSVYSFFTVVEIWGFYARWSGCHLSCAYTHNVSGLDQIWAKSMIYCQ